MSTPSTTRASSASNANRGGRSAQRNAGARPAAAKAASPPVAAFPQPLPARFARLIDGVNVTSITVSYTRYGMTVDVVTPTGTVPLEQYEARHKAVAAARVLEKDLKMYRDRIAERQLAAPAAAVALEPIGSEAGLQQWLEAWKGADPASFKILVMNNRNFRAQQGANAASA